MRQIFLVLAVITASQWCCSLLSLVNGFSPAATTRILLFHRKRQHFNRLGAKSQDADQLREQARKLREEIDSFNKSKESQEERERMEAKAQMAFNEARRERYSAIVPILKPDGKIVEERCDFTPRWKEEGASFITVVESALPIGVILGESDVFPGAVSVDELGKDSNGGIAGLQVGDLVRAFTACRMEMETPTWQLLAGGIGRPKTFRFMYSSDNRPFEEVMEAIASNRMDPEQRPVLIVVERKEK